MKTLVLFDFDGTITYKDSLIEFIMYAVGKSAFYFGMLRLSPMLVMYKLKLIHNQKAKEKMLSYFFKDISREDFNKIATQFALEQIDTIVRKKAIDKILWHQKEGHSVVMVSASIECWLRPWCEKYSIELIGTKLAFIDEKFSGMFEGKNCYGIEKENRVRQQYDLKEFDTIYAYGDSAGDKELLGLADKSFYKPFRTQSRSNR